MWGPEKQADARMDRAIHRAAWSQLKARVLQVYVLQMGCVLYRKTCILRKRIPLSLCNLCCNEDRSPAKSANVQWMGYEVHGRTSVLQNRLMWAYVSYPSSSYVLQSGPRSLLRALLLQWTISCKISCDTKGEANIFYLQKKLYMLQSYDMWTKSKSHQYFDWPFINMNTTGVHYIGHQDSAHIGVIKSWCPIYWTQINNNI